MCGALSAEHRHSGTDAENRQLCRTTQTESAGLTVHSADGIVAVAVVELLGRTAVFGSEDIIERAAVVES